jgi:S1-C subfamily serine protease
MKRLVAVVTMLFCGVASSAEFSVIRQYSKPVVVSKQILGRETPVGNGSAIVIAPSYMITAAHTVLKDPAMMLSVGVEGTQLAKLTVVKVDPVVDLALVSAPEIKCPCATFASGIERDEQAWTVGFPKFGYYHTQFVTTGTMQGMLNGRIVATPNAAPGSSGGGIFVKRGAEYQFAGVVVAIGADSQGPIPLGITQETQWITFSVPASTVKAFLKGTPSEIK